MKNLKTYALSLLCLLNLSVHGAQEIQGHYGCWYDIQYATKKEFSDSVSSLIERADFEVLLDNLIASLRDEVCPLIIDYNQLPFLFLKTDHGDYLLMHIDVNILMEENAQTQDLRAKKRCDLQIVMDQDVLAEHAEDYGQFISKLSTALAKICDDLEPLLKQHESFLLLEANKPALTLSIDVTFDQDIIDSMVAAGFITPVE